ncbi:MAG: DNA-binding transcriptional regulator [bacterium]|nr:DNA-binding transcriptional regulator [bacterium]
MKRVLILNNAEAHYARQIIRGFVAYSAGAGPWLVRVRPTSLPEGALKAQISEMNPDALVVHGVRPATLARALPRKLPVIYTSTEKAVDCPMLVPDNEAIGRLGAEHFLERNFLHYAFVGYEDRPVFVARHDGYRRRLAEAGRSCHAWLANTFQGLLTLYGVDKPEAVRRWLLALPKPCAVFAACDAVAYGLLELCLQLRIRVPEDLAVLGADDDSLICQVAHPPLSSIQIPFAEIGFESARLLDQWMKGRHPGALVRRFPPIDIAVRQSTDIHKVDDPVVAQALRFMTEHRGEAFRVGNLVRLTGVSRTTLEQRFKDTLRRTPLMEIRRQRIEYAKRLLADGRQPVGAIARLCGFNSLVRFSTVFRELTGLPPTEYRRKLNPAIQGLP